MGPERVKNDPLVNKTLIEIPGPGEYKSDEALLSMKEGKDLTKTAFRSNIDRFKITANEVPGPGNYKLPTAFAVRSASQHQPSFGSSVKKELKLVGDTDIPGAGAYNPQDFNSIGSKRIEGGAPNNFSLLVSQVRDTSHRSSPIQEEKIKESTRAILAETSSKKLRINNISSCLSWSWLIPPKWKSFQAL